MTTNKSAELQAAVIALIVAKKRDRRSVVVHTDSAYVRQSVNEFIPLWRDNGWRKPDGSVSPNLKWLKLLSALQEEMDVEWEWISEGENRKADRLAQMGTKVVVVC